MKENNNGNIPFYIALSVFFIIAVLGLTYMIQNSNSYNERGTFGDMFGFANALFTGLSFIGLIGTILLQRKDLNIQREELREQTNLVHKQNFESSFFQLLSMFNSIVNNMTIVSMESTYYGRHVFSAMINTFNSMLIRKAGKGQDMNMDQLLELIKKLHKEDVIKEYDDFYESYKEYLGHYFASFYHIINYIHITKNIDKNFYISIARSQLSSFELILLFYYGVSTVGKKKTFTLLIKYDVLQGVDYNLMYNNSPKSEYDLKCQ